jgi:uncharacterized damage-inducible protein DinB
MPALVAPVIDEKDGLLGYLRQQRSAVCIAAHGLTSDQAMQTPTPSKLSIGAIVKHLAHVERLWANLVQGSYHAMSQDEGFRAYAASLKMMQADAIGDLLASYETASSHADLIYESSDDMGRDVQVPDAPWFPKGVTWSVRWVMLHVIEETARHAGHTDIIRESIDGADSRSLMAAAEAWPENSWIKPWRPTQS